MDKYDSDFQAFMKGSMGVLVLLAIIFAFSSNQFFQMMAAASFACVAIYIAIKKLGEYIGGKFDILTEEMKKR